MSFDDSRLELFEQQLRAVNISPEDCAYVEKTLGFQVVSVQTESSAPGILTCLINPYENVGHFRLPSGRIVIITPKIEFASIFRMLAYVFTDGHMKWLRDEPVAYASDKLLFEPLVRFLNQLVSRRIRRGLVRDYMRREQNLTSFRGALSVGAHVQQNLGTPNRVFCRFFEQTIDIPDNRLIKTALCRLIHVGNWTPATTHDLISNFHHFDGVSLDRTRLDAAQDYNRLNDDYRPIHAMCRMFLASMSVSEKHGNFVFDGFLLNMNKLFECFVQQAFMTVLRRDVASAEVQLPRRFSSNPAAPNIRPDVVVRHGSEVQCIADAKYKRNETGADMYQVITYGTALNCPDTYLVYPARDAGSDIDEDFAVLNSAIIVRTRRIDISTPSCIANAEGAVRSMIGECQNAMRLSA